MKVKKSERDGTRLKVKIEFTNDINIASRQAATASTKPQPTVTAYLPWSIRKQIQNALEIIEDFFSSLFMQINKAYDLVSPWIVGFIDGWFDIQHLGRGKHHRKAETSKESLLITKFAKVHGLWHSYARTTPPLPSWNWHLPMSWASTIRGANMLLLAAQCFRWPLTFLD